MTTTDDARLLEIEAKVAREHRNHFPPDDLCFLLDRLTEAVGAAESLIEMHKTAESRIRELERIAEDALGMLDAVGRGRAQGF